MTHTNITHSRIALYLSGAVIASALIGVLVAVHTSKADDRYTFLVRGDVMNVDKANKNIKVYLRHVNSAAEHQAGETLEINVGSATFYKYDSKQRKVRTTFGTLGNGDEVVLRGRGGGGTFDADWVVENDNLVKILGKVDSQDITNNFLKIELESITYQSTGKAYKTKSFAKSDIVRVYYDEDSAKFTSRDGKAMNEDEISNNNEKITLKNIKVKYGSRFEADAATPVSEIIDGKHL